MKAQIGEMKLPVVVVVVVKGKNRVNVCKYKGGTHVTHKLGYKG